MKKVAQCVIRRVRGVRQRTWLKLFLGLCVLWFFWHPKRMDALFMTIPADATVASFHDRLDAEWRGLTRHPQLVAVLEGLGVEDAGSLKDNRGVYQTLYWLTGRHTVLGYVPGPWSYTGGGLETGSLAGASYVGWKAKIMELLWRVKWVPGLGRLQTTPSGTRYLAFKVDEAFGGVLFLGLDIADGVLMATLSRNPEDVRLLADRLHRFGPRDAPAEAFGGTRPWLTPLDAVNRFWIRDPHLIGSLAGVRVDVGSLRQPTLDLDVRLEGVRADDIHPLRTLDRFSAPAIPGADLPADAGFLHLAADVRLLDWAVGRMGRDARAFWPGSADGLCVIRLTGKPYEGRLVRLACPAVMLSMPWPAGVAFGEWAATVNFLLQREGALALRATYRTDDAASAFFVFPSELERFGRADVRDMFFAEHRAGVFHAGTHYGSYLSQRAFSADTERDGAVVADVVSDWQNRFPEAVAVVRLDVPRAAREFRHLGAIVRLALPFFGQTEHVAPVVGFGSMVDGLRVFSPLGSVEAVVFRKGDDGLRVRVSSQASER